VLGMRFQTEGAEQANRQLDQLAEKAGKAERATDKLAGSQKCGATATDQMRASLERTMRSAQDATRAVGGGGGLNVAPGTTQGKMRAAATAASVLGVGLTATIGAIAAVGVAAVAAWNAIDKFREAQERLGLVAKGVGSAVGLTADAINSAA